MSDPGSGVPSGTRRLRDGTGWQDVGGYSRAVRRGALIAVSGTTAHGPDGAALFPGDTYAQAAHCIGVVLGAVRALGGTPDDVVRTRVLLAPDADWQAATRAHGEAFAAVLPANSTYYVAGLIGEGFLVEVEAEAFVAADPDARADPDERADPDALVEPAQPAVGP